MPSRGRFRAVGKCYVCQGPVEAHTSRYVVDVVRWTDPNGMDRIRPVRRLVHRGECESTLRARLDIGKKPKGVDVE